MTEKEFIYAAKMEGGKAAEKQVKAYIAENPKADYDTDDWMKAMAVKRGFQILNRPGWSSMGDGNRTTRYSRKGGIADDDKY